MKKTLVFFFVLLILCFIYVCNYSYSNTKVNSYDLFFPDMLKRTTPNDLLVMVFLYDDYVDHNEKIDYVFNMTDEEIKTKYYSEIFGSGNIHEQTWSVNDFYRENSNGKFYFNPILIGNNETGIYPIRLNKTYDVKNFSSDIKEGFEILADDGFVPDDKFKGRFSGKAQEKHVICIFPTINIAHLGTYALNEEITSDVVVMDYRSVVSTTTHELGHAIGMPDLYGQGGQATLMGEVTLRSTIPDLRYPEAYNNHTIPAHVDPLHKIALGWHNYEIVDENSTVKLYPTTSSLYNMVIVPTEDNNQYYVIENRKADSFESQITMYTKKGNVSDPEDAMYSNYEGINIWRVDKLGYGELRSSQTCDRKGDFVISVLKNSMDVFFPRKYSNISDSCSNSKENTNIKIAYLQKNEDGSIDIDISFDDKYTNSYVVRYNANNGTNDYVDKSYYYGQTVDFSKDIFAENGNEIIGWNTKPDGSGTNYYLYNNVYGLSDENEDVVNLYAQWKQKTYKLTFNANGGEGKMDDQKFTYDISQKISKNIYTKEGYIFKQWNTNADGSGDAYIDEQEIKLSENLTLYVIWEETYSYVINKYSIDENKKYIDKIDINTTVEDFKKNINLNTGYTIDVNYKTIDDISLLYTGGKTNIYYNNNLIIEYTNIIRGEVNGDGKINYLDYVSIYNHIYKTKHPESTKKILENEYLISADMYEDEKVNYLDYVKIYNKIKELKVGSN